MIDVLRATGIIVLATAGLSILGYGLWLIAWDVRDRLASRRLS